MKQVLFFAVKSDLMLIFEEVERSLDIKYVRVRKPSSSDVDVFEFAAEIPNLGVASSDSAIGCEAFLVCLRDSIPVARSVQATTGPTTYLLDQLMNPDSVTLTPAGAWNSEILLHGRVATASDSVMSHILMKRFYAAIRERFTKIKAFWVGEGARAFLSQGKRLAIAVQSPRDFDLTETP